MRRHFFSLKLHQSTVGSVDGADVLANAPIEARTPSCGRMEDRFLQRIRPPPTQTAVLNLQKQGSAGR